MNRILNLIFCFSLSLAFNISYSQTVIDYSAWSSSQCNAFYPSANVNNITHTTTCGTTIYDNVNHAIELDTRAENNIYKGTEYKIGFNFKQGYSYTIKINAWCNTPTFPVPNSKMRVDFNSASNGSGAFCNDVESFNTTSSLTSNNNQQLNPGAYFDYTFQYNELSVAQSFLYIGGFLPYINGTATSWILIKKITITETTPSPAFTITPSSVSISCGSTTPITFTATGSNIPNGAIVTYSWKLGSTPNGWFYDGNPAPQIISTGTTNTVTLTPVCGASQSNISATATVNSTNYNTNTSAVTVTPPSLTIQGNTSFCSGTSFYSLVGTIPCNATVIWTATPSGIISLPPPPSGSSVTVTQVGDGIATLTATINACNNFAVSQPIALGLPDRPKVLDEMGKEIRTVSTCTNTHKSLCPTVDSKWNVLEWEWEKVVGNFNLIDFESCADILGFQPGSGFISVRVRNACGWSNPTFIVVNITDCNNMTVQQRSVKLFPNPATSSVTLSVDSQTDVQTKSKVKEDLPAASINEVKIFDSYGTLKVYRKYNKQQTATLDISRLPKGIYVVEVNTGSRLEYQQLIIQR